MPLIPLLFMLMGGSGLAGLWWYYTLPEAERLAADQVAEDVAQELYGMAVDKLNREQARVVHARVHSHFNN
jgi:hypothetical protein